MTLDQKIHATKQFIRQSVSSYKSPILMWSGGKDSMALLHLLRSMNLFWPVILYRNIYFPHKYAFANRIIQEWQLVVHEYPPIKVGLQQKNGQVELVHWYLLGPNTHVHIPTNMIPIEAWDWQCGIRLLARPTGGINFPWDVLYIGHKSCDTDITEGDLTLHTSIHRNVGAPDLAFPLREWTHEDVWDYTRRFNVPVQETRYEPDGKRWKERTDKTYNPDCTPICIRCVDKRLSGDVECPLLNKKIPSIAQSVEYLPDHGLTYFGAKVEMHPVAQEA